MQPRHAREVDRRLGVAGTREHTSLAIAQREDVTGSCQVLGPGALLEDGVHGRAPVGGGDPGGGAVAGVDRHGEGGALRLRVLRDHEWDPQLVETVTLDRHADDTAGVADHERHRLGRHLLGRDDEVALVLAVDTVDDDHHLAPGDRLDGTLDLREGHVLSLLPRLRANVPHTSRRCRPRGSPDRRPVWSPVWSPRGCEESPRARSRRRAARQPSS